MGLTMSNVIILGAQWGDEGKGKVVDLFSERFDVVARYQGGHNAGHTVRIGDRKFVLKLIPSGILRPGKKAVIGNGLVVDPAALLDEIQMLEAAGLQVEGNLFISNRAQVLLPTHRLMEKLGEARPGRVSIGTTSRGIGPCYEDKIARRGMRIGDLMDREVFEPLFDTLVAEHQTAARALGVDDGLDADSVRAEYERLAERIRPMVCDTARLLHDAIAAGQSVMFEGAQGTMLDIDHGTYPFVTSSNATSGGVATGLGVAPTRLTGVVGVTKAYTTRVGSGPFPTEMPDLDAQALRERGKEFGAVTGRPRRCGWLDLEVLRFAKMLSGIDSLVVTKLDVFDAQKEIKICTGYRYKGKRLTEMPPDTETLAEIEPEYHTMPGWQTPTPGIRDVKGLPLAARDYLNFISDQLQVEIGMISTGPERDATIVPRGTKLASWL